MGFPEDRPPSEVPDIPYELANHSAYYTPLMARYNLSALLGYNDSEVPFPSGGMSGWIDKLLDDMRKGFFMHNYLPTTILIGLYCVTFLLGLMGNLLVIIVFARNRKMRTVTNSFLVNLAVCDLMVVCVCMPFSVAVEIYSSWIYGNILCKLVNFAQGMSVSTSIMTLTVISAERFYAIRRPLRARAFMCRRRIQTIICAIWLLSAFTVVPSLFVRHLQEEEIMPGFTLRTCVEEWQTLILKHTYNFALLFILYLSPVLFICVGYMQIAMNLWRTDSSLHACASAAESQNARANLSGRRRVAKMLFVMAILFAVSWLPVHVMGIVLDFLKDDQFVGNGRMLRVVFSYTLWLAHVNSSINPVCYVFMSSSFKTTLRMELRRCFCRRQGQPFHRESFMSLSMAMTMSTNSGGSLSRRLSSRVLYKPIVDANGRIQYGPDLLRDIVTTRERYGSEWEIWIVFWSICF